ncbi:rho GDP-dissociation inhibitor 1-like [Haliotis cracherodii]|uniref:rho GDP-dissociation inhibitor 1-like n=1 Tax=Haliotis cracherodii TaxID=6455 RepID=UPI0039EC4574
MAEQNEDPIQEVGDDDTDNPNYRPPAQKTLTEIQKLDEDDESLQKYKKTLLGEVSDPPKPDDPRNVIVEKLAFCSEGRPEIEMDLSGDLSKLRTFIVKEGTQYKIKIYFYVQREIVSGLVYKQKIVRKGIKVENMKMMVGSYGPKKDLNCYTTSLEDVPSGMLARGTYTIKSQFTDDDKNNYLEWQFGMEIKKDWEN